MGKDLLVFKRDPYSSRKARLERATDAAPSPFPLDFCQDAETASMTAGQKAAEDRRTERDRKVYPGNLK